MNRWVGTGAAAGRFSKRTPKVDPGHVPEEVGPLRVGAGEVGEHLRVLAEEARVDDNGALAPVAPLLEQGRPQLPAAGRGRGVPNK